MTTPERPLELPMRILLGVLGTVALGVGIVIGLRELRLMRSASLAITPLALAILCALVALGGAVLIRGAVRGRITVRRPGHRTPIL